MTGPSATVDICVCTFRRKHIAQTLQSLAQLALPADCRVSVIVADNDETPAARNIVEAAAKDIAHPILYLHAPCRNISVARNACLDAARGKFVAFIDDDEVATSQWIEALLTQQSRGNADVVLGRVLARYPDNSPAWLQNKDFLCAEPTLIKERIVTGYTGNVLFLREAPVLRGLRFDPKLGRSGGEDTAFFSAVYKAGGRIDYAPDAVVMEDVGTERLAFAWLLKRSFRKGQTHGMLLLADNSPSSLRRLFSVVVAGAKAAYCGVVALFHLIAGDSARFWVLRGVLHIGVVARLLGIPEIAQYG